MTSVVSYPINPTFLSCVVLGPTQLADLTVNGTITFNGPVVFSGTVTFADVVFNGNSTINGNLTVNGNVDVVQNPSTLAGGVVSVDASIIVGTPSSNSTFTSTSANIGQITIANNSISNVNTVNVSSALVVGSSSIYSSTQPDGISAVIGGVTFGANAISVGNLVAPSIEVSTSLTMTSINGSSVTLTPTAISLVNAENSTPLLLTSSSAGPGISGPSTIECTTLNCQQGFTVGDSEGGGPSVFAALKNNGEGQACGYMQLGPANSQTGEYICLDGSIPCISNLPPNTVPYVEPYSIQAVQFYGSVYNNT